MNNSIFIIIFLKTTNIISWVRRFTFEWSRKDTGDNSVKILLNYFKSGNINYHLEIVHH